MIDVGWTLVIPADSSHTGSDTGKGEARPEEIGAATEVELKEKNPVDVAPGPSRASQDDPPPLEEPTDPPVDPTSQDRTVGSHGRDHPCGPE